MPTIREIGAEIVAELLSVPESDIRWDVKHVLVDLVMGVLARHSGSIIENDADFPVAPLEPRNRSV